jgi:transcriptional regulator with XRE-family HTH domain
MARTPLGHFLREWREYRGYSLKEVEAGTGIKHSSLGRIERGEYGYEQRHLEALADFYRTQPALLLGANPLVSARPIRGRQKLRNHKRLD